MEYPLWSIIENLEATGRITKWAAELNPYCVKYEPRAEIKGQVLTDFIAEFIPRAPIQSDSRDGWILNVDRASNNRGQAPSHPKRCRGFHHRTILHTRFPCLKQRGWVRRSHRWAENGDDLQNTGLEVHCNSTLVVCQVSGEYVAKDERMEAYLQLVLSLKVKFSCCDFERISRSENNHIDSLANLASTMSISSWGRFLSSTSQLQASCGSTGRILCLDISLGWRKPIIAYLKGGALPNDKAEAQKL